MGYEDEAKSQEPAFRLNLKQTAKGEIYFDVTVRADSLDELKTRIKDALMVAEQHSTVKPQGGG